MSEPTFFHAAYSSVDVAGFSDMSVPFYETTHCRIPKDGTWLNTPEDDRIWPEVG